MGGTATTKKRSPNIGWRRGAEPTRGRALAGGPRLRASGAVDEPGKPTGEPSPRSRLSPTRRLPTSCAWPALPGAQRSLRCGVGAGSRGGVSCGCQLRPPGLPSRCALLGKWRTRARAPFLPASPLRGLGAGGTVRNGSRIRGSGGVRLALSYFKQFAESVPAASRRDAGWHIGKCSYDLAQEYRRRWRPRGGFGADRGKPYSWANPGLTSPGPT